MKIKPIFLATGKNGEVRIHKKDKFVQFVQGLGDGIIEITAQKRRRTRSLEQNAYYWAVIIPIVSDWMGENDFEVTHDILKSRFNEKRNRKGHKYVGSTTKMTTTEFMEYLDKIIKWCAENSIIIPPANSVKY